MVSCYLPCLFDWCTETGHCCPYLLGPDMDGQIMEWIFRNCHVQPDGGKHFTHHSAMTSGREEYSSGFDNRRLKNADWYTALETVAGVFTSTIKLLIIIGLLNFALDPLGWMKLPKLDRRWSKGWSCICLQTHSWWNSLLGIFLQHTTGLWIFTIVQNMLAASSHPVSALTDKTKRQTAHDWTWRWCRVADVGFRITTHVL